MPVANLSIRIATTIGVNHSYCLSEMNCLSYLSETSYCYYCCYVSLSCLNFLMKKYYCYYGLTTPSCLSYLMTCSYRCCETPNYLMICSYRYRETPSYLMSY